VRIILAADSNDTENKFIKKLTILEKNLHYGTEYKPTCCTTVVIPIHERGRDERRIRHGDIILDSDGANNSFKYEYPQEKENEPYSDHAPITTQLSVANLKRGGRKKTRRRRRKRTKRKKKRKRRRKSRKRRRKRTKKRRRRR
jgi:hypothetical protein